MRGWSDQKADMKLSIVIPTRNRAVKLERTLRSLAVQTVPPNAYEVVVVDNGSSDGTAELLPRYGRNFPNWQGLREAQPGAAAARNRGVLASRGEVVVFLDDDVIATSDLLQEHLNAQAAHRGSAVLGYVRNGWNETGSAFYWVLSHKELMHSFRFSDPSDVSFVHFYSCNVSIPRAALLRVGLFDEGFTGAAFEDIDLGYRLRRSGCRLIFNSNATVTHEPVLSLDGFRHKRFNAGSGLHRLITKHPELQAMLVPSAPLRVLRSKLGRLTAVLGRTFERPVPLRRLLLPVLGQACWFHLEHHFWAGFNETARL